MLSYAASAMVMLVRPVRGVRDYSCGFRAYRASAIKTGFATYGESFVSERGFACMMEIAERLREDAAFAEVPFVLRYQDKRKASEIKIGPTIGAYFRVIAKVASTRRKPVPRATLAIAFGAIAFSSTAQLLLRLGMAGAKDMSVIATLGHAAGSPTVLSGLALYAISSALWLGVLSRMELSVAYPLGASGYIIVVILAAISGESVPPARWAGVAVIALGVLLVGWLGVAPVKRVSRR
jgi:multidrug transporter EmrE-like cation transporter